MAPEGAGNSANEWLSLALYDVLCWVSFYRMAPAQVSTFLTGLAVPHVIKIYRPSREQAYSSVVLQ